MTYDPRAYWDARCDSPGTVGLHKWMMAQISHLKPQSILEFGCGNGLLTAELQTFGVPIRAFDISEEMIARAKQRVAASFEVADAVTWSSTEMFDMVIGFTCLQHIPPATVSRAVSNLLRCCQKWFVHQDYFGPPLPKLLHDSSATYQFAHHYPTLMRGWNRRTHLTMPEEPRQSLFVWERL